MSYTILYDKQFIKAEKNGEEVFFPMVYGGSNNCYECTNSTRGRRERNWFLMSRFSDNKKYGTLEEMIACVEAEREEVIKSNELSNKHYAKMGKESWCENYSDSQFGYFVALAINGATRTTSFGKYKGLFVTGCRKALTVEELKEFHVNVKIRIHIFDEETEKKFKEAGKEQKTYYPKTSNELIEVLEEVEEYLKDFPEVHFYVGIDASEYTMKHIRKIKFPTKNNKS